MPNRRSFLAQQIPVAALASSITWKDEPFAAGDESKDPRAPYVVQVVVTRLHSVQLQRVLEWLEKRALAFFQRYLPGPQGFFTVDVGPHVPAVISFRAFPDLAALETAWAKLNSDAGWAEALAEAEASGPPYARQDWMVLAATPFSPPLKAAGPGDATHKVFEFRTYRASTLRRLRLMHERFTSGEIEIFHKVGIHPVFYADTLLGTHLPSMNYLIPFEDLAHREQAWDAFRATQEWKRLSDEYLQKSGELALEISNMLLVPTSFSMFR